MFNLDGIVKIYYSYVSIQAILENRVRYDEFPREEFVSVARAYDARHSDTEEEQLYRYIGRSIGEEGHPFAGMAGRSGLNVFAALEELAEQLLTMEGGQVRCIYRKLVRFREVTNHVDEELLICAFLAMRYKRLREEHTDFSWNVAVSHDNTQLMRIVGRGISDNHFHLYGSAPYFHLLWCYLMNHVGDGILHRVASGIEKGQRVSREHYSITYGEDSFADRILKAALIRICLMYCLIGWKIEGPAAEADSDMRWVEWLLSGKGDIKVYYYQIQKMIDYVREYALLADGEEYTDYASCGIGLAEGEVNGWFAGERWLSYRILRDELAERNLPDICYQWFYAYQVIKNSIRRELLLVNGMVGFDNFAIYSRRKGSYPNYRRMVESAVRQSLEGGNVRSLELRVVPKKTAEQNAAMVREINEILCKRKPPVPQSRYYFVFHFTKGKDDPLPAPLCFHGLCCRHYRKRLELEEIANGIRHFRERYPKEAVQLRGIDACSQEIGCRPEVFAPVYRFLSEHIVEGIFEKMRPGQLKLTYHVGEDFLDVADGLRAVDEAVHFLNLRCGDRIGHGTVLGIDVGKWYLFKENTIVLPQQDYLDNVVWLYHKLTEYGITGMDVLKEQLLKDFDFYFSQIYGSSMGKKARVGNIYLYYEAWKLRGDDPELYLNGKFDQYEMRAREWVVNRKYPERFESREREEVGFLYSLYHYDWHVRDAGGKTIQVHVSPQYVRGVEAVQHELGAKFAQRGIGVETNPSSNLAISPIERYDEHPIVKLYNKGMTWDTEKLAACPQMNVSINTDDKGVFRTSLENEYALMACALEHVKDEEGKPVYNRQMIYQWIDNVREMGNLQSFGEYRQPEVGEENGQYHRENYTV